MKQADSDFAGWTPTGFDSHPSGDQADGLRRMFKGSSRRWLPVVANPHIATGSLAVEQIAAALLRLGRSTLVVDSSPTAPAVDEACALGLACCIQNVTPNLGYLAARELPRRYVDTRGSAGRLLEELEVAAPTSDAVIVHAEVTDLARIFKGRAARPILLAADNPDSVKHAYAAWKLLAGRCEWLSADLVLLAPRRSPRASQIAATLSQCADSFMGAVLAHWVAVDPFGEAGDLDAAGIRALASSQLELDDTFLPTVTGHRASAAADAAFPTAHH